MSQAWVDLPPEIWQEYLDETASNARGGVVRGLIAGAMIELCALGALVLLALFVHAVCAL